MFNSILHNNVHPAPASPEPSGPSRMHASNKVVATCPQDRWTSSCPSSCWSTLAHEQIDARVELELVQVCLVAHEVHEQTPKGYKH